MNGKKKWVQRKNNPHGAEEGYCLSRTRKKLIWLIWALLMLVIAASLGVSFAIGLDQDRTYWEKTNYITLAVSGSGAVLMALLGLYLAYVAVRDAFFPAKSFLAQSIRNQLPYPDEAPSVEKLFAMVDNDLKENARWFGPVGIGREWVLGEGATKIDRIRGIFVIDEIHQYSTQSGTRTRRNMELVLIDDRWQRMTTSFNNPKDLKAAGDFLALLVPDAARGNGGQCSGFYSMNEIRRESFEREFRNKRNRRDSEMIQREAMSAGSQNMILKAGGEVTSRVTNELVEEYLRRCLEQELESFTLTPNRPIESSGKALRAMNVSARDGVVTLTAELAAAPGEKDMVLIKSVDYQEALAELTAWLRLEAPKLKDWELRRSYGSGVREISSHQHRKSQARLSLIYASGAAENHITFTEEDVRIAAEGIVDGSYQMVDLTHPVGYMWIRVTAGSKADGRCTVEAACPEDTKLGFYITKMPPRKVAEWLMGYPSGEFLPRSPEWKKVKKPK